jgi:hypothetical protein
MRRPRVIDPNWFLEILASDSRIEYVATGRAIGESEAK